MMTTGPNIKKPIRNWVYAAFMVRIIFTASLLAVLTACSTAPLPPPPHTSLPPGQAVASTPVVRAVPSTLPAIISRPAPVTIYQGPSLPDRVAFSQKDPRWSEHKMGGSGARMGREGCLVTATAMALGNIGIDIDPGELNHGLKQNGGYTATGQLIWSGIDKVTNGRATARYHDRVSTDIIDSCMLDGFYPMARFILPNGRTHWSMIVSRSSRGFYMRDPLHPSQTPLLFPRDVSALEAVRCVGPGKGSKMRQ